MNVVAFKELKKKYIDGVSGSDIVCKDLNRDIHILQSIGFLSALVSK